MAARERAPRRGVAVGAVALSAVVLAGCTLYDSLFAKKAPPLCPRVALQPEAATVTKFRSGPGRDIIDIVYQGEILDFVTACEYALDDKTGAGALTMEIALVFGAERGAADRERKAALRYFVGVTGEDGQILNKEVFSTTMDFAGNVTKLSKLDEPVTLDIPLRPGQSGAAFEVVVGFQLDADELEFNRRRGGLR